MRGCVVNMGRRFCNLKDKLFVLVLAIELYFINASLIHRKFEYKYSFKPPYLAQKDGSVPFWEYGGSKYNFMYTYIIFWSHLRRTAIGSLCLLAWNVTQRQLLPYVCDLVEKSKFFDTYITTKTDVWTYCGLEINWYYVINMDIFANKHFI